MRRPRTRQPRCTRCETRPAVDGGLCFLDILFLAKKAARAYDAIRVREPVGAQTPARVRQYIDAGHDGHAYAPRVGCPFCVLRP